MYSWRGSLKNLVMVVTFTRFFSYNQCTNNDNYGKGCSKQNC